MSPLREGNVFLSMSLLERNGCADREFLLIMGFSLNVWMENGDRWVVMKGDWDGSLGGL